MEPTVDGGGRASDREAIPILFCCDPGYYQHLAVAIASLVLNNPGNGLDIRLITSSRDPEQERRLRASIPPHPRVSLRLHDFSWDNRARWHTSFHITREAYTRLFAPEILDASLDRIIYLDSDLVVVDDLAPLWATDLGDDALAAVADPFGASRPAPLGMPEGRTYVNSGVLLLNLARWRSEGLSARLGDYIGREGSRLLFHDQDALNAVLHASTRLLHPRWNVQAKLYRPPRSHGPIAADAAEALKRPAIVHYTSASKPWLFTAAVAKRSLYWRYLRATAWRGARPAGRRPVALAEFAVNHLTYLLRIDFTWDRLLRSTTAGRGLARALRLPARCRSLAARMPLWRRAA